MQALIADDDPVSRRRIEVLLQRWGFEVVAASDGTEAWQILRQEDPPRLAILDWMMPGMDGLQVCQEVRKLNKGPYLYLLLLTAKDQRDDVIEGLEAGADEYLCKPVDPSELKARVRAGCRILELQERLAATCRKFEADATHDALTGLWNRAAILEILQRELAHSHREGSPVSVVIADIDHFKQINDTQGHRAGDAVLLEITRRMQSQIRPYDSLGRYGGEEFLIVVPGSALDGARALAERIRLAVCHEPMDAKGAFVHATISLGIAVSEGFRDGDSLIHAADEALYRAKNAGRNRVERAFAPAVS